MTGWGWVVVVTGLDWVCHDLSCLLSSFPGLKGGPLLSMLHSFSHHGDPSVRLLVKQLLTHAYRPVNMILGKWLFEGQLNDTFHEVGM